MNDDGGQIIPERILDEFLGPMTVQQSVYSRVWLKYPRRPLTRRDRIRGRLYDIRWYLRHLALALVNRCDREREYDE